MKRIILSVMLVAFAAAVQGDEAKCAQNKDKSACCSHKVKTSIESKESGGCPFAKGACCNKQVQIKQTALLSPKALDTAK